MRLRYLLYRFKKNRERKRDLRWAREDYRANDALLTTATCESCGTRGLHWLWVRVGDRWLMSCRIEHCQEPWVLTKDA